MKTDPPCQFLDWDSRFFGRRIARVKGHIINSERLAAIEGWCREQNIEGLYFLADADDPSTVLLAEENGFHLVDVRVTLQCEFTEHIYDRNSDSRNVEFTLRSSRPDDIPQLQEIARASYGDSRFFYDACLQWKQAEALFAEWIKRSCHDYADIVFVAELRSRPVGYISCHLESESNEGRIGLVGVHHRARGNGIGQALVVRGLEWFGRNDLAYASVVTQGRNVAAQRLYQKCGFLTAAVQLWYHRWFIECGGKRQ